MTYGMKRVWGAAAMVALGLLSGGVQGCDDRQGNGPAEAKPAKSASAGIRFRDVARSSGIQFRWNEKPHRPLRIIDAMGCGCAFVDYDQDGYQDILLVNEPTVGLFRNNGQGGFTDVTAAAGLSTIRGPWKGCAVGDFDGDGWRDLLLTGFHRLALLRSRGGEKFEDVTRAAGLDPENWKDWASSAGFMDLDQDGDLDLVVQNYVVWGPHVMQLCTFEGIQTGCPPKVYDPERPRLFRNEGNGKFTDVSRASGFMNTTGVGLVIGFADSDEDGRTDIYLGNDAVDADFMHNLGGLKFRNIALENGTIYGKSQKPLASMGIDWADVDRDGHLDFAASDFSRSSYSLFRNDGEGLFSDIAAPIGLAAPTYDPLGFGVKFADVDNDGWSDLFIVNGHVYDRVSETDPGLSFRQPCMLFRNEGGKRITDIVPSLGGDLARPILGRGSATGDYDGDGRIDLMAVDLEGEALLFHNETEPRQHWTMLELRGSGGNWEAYGARVTMTSGTERWTAEVSPTSSYLSSSDPRIHFGLGGTSRIETLVVRWPSGKEETYKDLPVDQVLTLREKQGFSPWKPSGKPTNGRTKS